MTTPGPYHPQYQNYYVPTNPRPTSVTVVAILGIIFGSLGMICAPFALLPHLTDISADNEIIALINENSLLWTWTMFSTIASFGLSILLLASSISALSLKSWARLALIYYAIVAIALAGIGAIINYAMILPALADDMPDATARSGMMIGFFGGTLLGVALPIVVLIIMTRPHVVAAFESAGAQQPYQMPGVDLQ